MRSSTTVKRRLAGYVKRKPKSNKPKFPPPRAKRPSPRHEGAVPAARAAPPSLPPKAPWLQAYGVPAVLLALIGLVIVFAGRIGNSISRPEIPISNSPRYSSPQASAQESGSSTADYASARHPQPTDQSFLATHYQHSPAAPSAAKAAGSNGTFHSTATGHCVVSTRNVRDIAALLDGCLRRPN